MAQYTYTSNGIIFSNINTENDQQLAFPQKHSRSNSWSRIQSGVVQNVQPFVNAVEIDWNGAKLGDTIIKIMGESVLFKGCSA